MKTLTATKLRENLYAVLDEVLETGVPAVVERKGRRIRIVPDNPPSRLERLEPHQIVVGDAEDLVHIDWSSNWEPGKELP